jgi:hypothetical protein
MSFEKKDAWTTFILCLVLGGSVIGDTLRYPDVQGQGFGQGPGFYPQVLAVTLILLGVLCLFQIFRRSKGGTGDQADQTDAPGIRYSNVILLLILSVILIACINILGFFIAGFLLTFLTVRLIRRAAWGKFLLPDLAFSVGIIILVYLVFEVFVGIDLPGSVYIS